MWHKPHLLTAISDLLFLMAGAALLVAAVLWAAPRMQVLPIDELSVTHELREVRRQEIDLALGPLLRGNFLTVNVDAVRLALEQLPWVRRAEVWRKWPSIIEVRIEEHQAAAFWGDGQDRLVNTHGEVFAASLSREQPLPKLSGPAGSAGEVLRRQEEFTTILQPTGRQPTQLTLSPRLAWLLKLEDGLLVELGREQAKAPIRARLQRFVDYYPTLSDTRHGRPIAVDMRYPNGFALRFAAGTVQDIKGKK
ncbi:MAG TPA: cell division protein FtsQ/DivIB [Accumulibacter sp.]|jgi:cell division protein FtsQ|nr:cell division protein FtsQ/DivIB [Accumulibacter sp.]HQC79854.1 cell division protein FtsQ/DivIB [Accumulibacter sp.]